VKVSLSLYLFMLIAFVLWCFCAVNFFESPQPLAKVYFGCGVVLSSLALWLAYDILEEVYK